MTEEVKPGKTLWHKLAEVQGELEALPKDARADIQTSGGGSYSYEYVTEAALMSAVRQKLADRGVAVSVSWTSVEFQGNLAVVKGAMFFTNGDAPGEREAIQLLGTGTDRGDKALYKAMTGATRYGLWKTFLIPAGIDNEQTNEPHSGTEGAANEPSPQAAQRIASIEKRVARLAELFGTSIAAAEKKFQAAVDRESAERGYGAKPWRQLPVGAMGEWIGRLDAMGQAKKAELDAEAAKAEAARDATEHAAEAPTEGRAEGDTAGTEAAFKEATEELKRAVEENASAFSPPAGAGVVDQSDGPDDGEGGSYGDA